MCISGVLAFSVRDSAVECVLYVNAGFSAARFESYGFFSEILYLEAAMSAVGVEFVWR